MIAQIQFICDDVLAHACHFFHGKSKQVSLCSLTRLYSSQPRKIVWPARLIERGPKGLQKQRGLRSLQPS